MIDPIKNLEKKKINNFFKNKNILITGGTGSFGKALLFNLLENYTALKKIVIFSRDELKQETLQLDQRVRKSKKVRFILGDIRNKDSIDRALEEIDIVIHAAALKQVVTAEYNPFEFIKTNVLGSQNIVESCLKNNVKNVIALSTDKASSPVNLYGATKLCSDKLFISGQNLVGKRNTKFTVVRYGNVMFSRGSVIPKFISDDESRRNLIITDKRMTRFNITLDQSVNFVIRSTINSKGGEIFVPKLPSYKITDLVKSINSKAKIKIIGRRPGEKLHEEMISSSESNNTIVKKDHFIILPSEHPNVFQTYNRKKYKFLKNSYSYSSENNSNFISIKNLSKVINNYKKNNRDTI